MNPCSLQKAVYVPSFSEMSAPQDPPNPSEKVLDPLGHWAAQHLWPSQSHYQWSLQYRK